MEVEVGVGGGYDDGWGLVELFAEDGVVVVDSGLNDVDTVGGALSGACDLVRVGVDDEDMFVVAEQLFGDLDADAVAAEDDDGVGHGSRGARDDAVEDERGGGDGDDGDENDHRVDRLADDAQLQADGRGGDDKGEARGEEETG